MALNTDRSIWTRNFILLFVSHMLSSAGVYVMPESAISSAFSLLMTWSGSARTSPVRGLTAGLDSLRPVILGAMESFLLNL